MRKHHKKHKSHHRIGRHRRRSSKSMGSVATDLLMNAAGLVVGAVAANKIGKMLPATINPKFVSAGQLVLGLALPKFVKTPIVASIGNGMAAVGGMGLLTSFVPSLGATDDVVLLSGIDTIGDMSEVNGVDQIGDLDAMNGSDISEVGYYEEY